MTPMPINYVELHSPDLEATRAFMSTVFGWAPEAFAAADYLVQAAPADTGVDTGLTRSQDGQGRTVGVITVPSLEATMTAVTDAGGVVVVPPFAISGVGRACYVTDPAGVLLGLHEYDADA